MSDVSESGSKRFLIHKNILNDMRHPCCTMISSWFTILPPFTSVLYKSLVKGGKIVNQELIIVQQRAAYRLVCFRVWEIVWNHFQTHRKTNYRVISVISLITSDSLSKCGRYWHISFFGATIKLFGIKYWLGPCLVEPKKLMCRYLPHLTISFSGGGGLDLPPIFLDQFFI